MFVGSQPATSDVPIPRKKRSDQCSIGAGQMDRDAGGYQIEQISHFSKKAPLSLSAFCIARFLFRSTILVRTATLTNSQLVITKN